MAYPKSIPELKKAIKGATKVYVWAPFARSDAGTVMGGFIEVYKSHVMSMMKEFQLPTSQYNKSVSCFFRVDPTSNALYIEGFHAAV